MEDELWSSLLEQVSSRSNNQKQVVLLGAPGTGQSTLVSLLKGKQRSSLDLGLSYEYLDVKDAADEDLLARIGLYGLRSPDRPLLQLALTPATLSDSLVVILLDWQQPWSFVSQLAFWFRLLQSVLQQDAPAHQDRIEAFLKAYQEPVLKEDGSVGTTPQPARDAAEAASLPLPFGTLSVNLGLPVVVVCTKSDTIDALEKDRVVSEEQIDHIQQTLRTICLYYGAALFFTSKLHQDTTSRLKAYILHRLFHKPAAPKAALSSSTPASAAFGQEATTSALRSFPFNVRAVLLEREAILIPAGWDSFGKIRVLKDSFDPSATSEDWSACLSSTADESAMEQAWRQFISDPRPRDLAPKPSIITAQDEQELLATQFQLLQKEQAKDPRSHFQSRSPAITSPNMGSGSESGLSPNAPSLVGPMSSTSLSLSAVMADVQASVQQQQAADAAIEQFTRRKDITSPPMRSPAASQTPVSPPVPQTNGTPVNPAASGTQNEVLANFFQSLLSARKDPNAPRYPAGTPVAASKAPPANQANGSAG